MWAQPAVWAIAAVLGIAACADPEVDVLFDVSGVDDVASVRLRILEPVPLTPAAVDPYDCDDVAFRIVEESTLELSTAVEVLIRESVGSGDLSGIPREGGKLILAEGSDESGRLVVAGCAPLGDVTSDVTVDITPEPATLVSVNQPPLDRPLPDSLPVIVTGVSGDPLGDIATRWLVVGPAGNTTVGETFTDNAGGALIRPEPTALPGPTVVEIQVRWLAEDPPILNAVELPALAFAGSALPIPIGYDESEGELLLGESRSSYTAGLIGPNGEPGFAALGPARPVTLARRLMFGFADASETTLVTDNLAFVGAITAVPDPAGGKARVLAKRASGWVEFEIDQGQITSTPLGATGTAAHALRLEDASDCEPGGARRLIAQLDQTAPADERIEVYDLDAGLMPVSSPFAPDPRYNRLVSTGCVASEDGSLHRVVVLSGARPSNCNQTDPRPECTLPRLLLAAENGVAIPLDAEPATIGFSQRVGTTPPMLLAPHLGIDGQGIGQFQLAMTPNPPVFEEVDRDITVFSPVLHVGGDFDGDDKLDVGGFVVTGIEDIRIRMRFLMSMGVEHRGSPLLGLAQEETGVGPDLRVLDFDRDGFDDILFATAQGFTVALFGKRGEP